MGHAEITIMRWVMLNWYRETNGNVKMTKDAHVRGKLKVSGCFGLSLVVHTSLKSSCLEFNKTPKTQQSWSKIVPAATTRSLNSILSKSCAFWVSCCGCYHFKLFLFIRISLIWHWLLRLYTTIRAFVPSCFTFLDYLIADEDSVLSPNFLFFFRNTSLFHMNLPSSRRWIPADLFDWAPHP